VEQLVASSATRSGSKDTLMQLIRLKVKNASSEGRNPFTLCVKMIANDSMMHVVPVSVFE